MTTNRKNGKIIIKLCIIFRQKLIQSKRTIWHWSRYRVTASKTQSRFFFQNIDFFPRNKGRFNFFIFYSASLIRCSIFFAIFFSFLPLVHWMHWKMMLIQFFKLESKFGLRYTHPECMKKKIKIWWPPNKNIWKLLFYRFGTQYKIKYPYKVS